jgi:hypothetical protein
METIFLVNKMYFIVVKLYFFRENLKFIPRTLFLGDFIMTEKIEVPPGYKEAFSYD